MKGGLLSLGLGEELGNLVQHFFQRQPFIPQQNSVPHPCCSFEQGLFSMCLCVVSSCSSVGAAGAFEALGQTSHLGELVQASACCPEPRARPLMTAENPLQASCATFSVQLCSLKPTARSGLCLKHFVWGQEWGGVALRDGL